MHPLAAQIPNGLNSWQAAGAKVGTLKKDKINVPRIWVNSVKNKVFLLIGGLHLEETSGPFLLLTPQLLLPVLEPLLKKGVNIVIYPAINQFGLSFEPSTNDKLLRYNAEGINYNDRWGIKAKKCKEVEVVEKDILSIKKFYEIIFAVSLHEDSETPQKGYIYTNGISDPNFRKKLRQGIISQVSADILASEKDFQEGIQSEFTGGKVEEEFCLVEAKDPGSMESWTADKLHVPTVLSESPFGLSLDTRKSFHLSVIASAISVLVPQI